DRGRRGHEAAGQERAQVVVGVARGELAEALPGPPVVEIRAQQALDRRGRLAGRYPVADRARYRLVEADGAADAEVVGVHERAVDLHLLALEADVGDPVLAARVRAAGDVDPHVAVEAGQPKFQRVDEPAREALGLREGQLAELAAGARDGAAAERR